MHKKIRESIEEGRYVDTTHARERQKERKITLSDALYVLKTGRHEKNKNMFDPTWNTWKYAIRGKTPDGENVRVIISFDGHYHCYDCISTKRLILRQNMKHKVQKEFEYTGFGFTIILVNVPMIEVMGVWTPHINYNKLQKILLIALAHKPIPLTGNELRFIRKYFELSMEEFGIPFGLTHAAVSKWENKKDQFLNTDINTERCLRLFIMDHLDVKDKDFRRVYKEVSDLDIGRLKKSDIEPFSFDAKKEELIAV